MSGYYAANSHYAPVDYSEDRERRERAEECAAWYFNDATKEQKAAHDRAMADLRGLAGPRYDRARAAAECAWHDNTAAARALFEETVTDVLANGGEVSEAMSYRWDELAVSRVMQAAE